jgi:hypothetical protein
LTCHQSKITTGPQELTCVTLLTFPTAILVLPEAEPFFDFPSSKFELTDPPAMPVLTEVFDLLDPPLKLISTDDPLFLLSLDWPEIDFEPVIAIFESNSRRN